MHFASNLICCHVIFFLLVKLNAISNILHTENQFCFLQNMLKIFCKIIVLRIIFFP